MSKRCNIHNGLKIGHSCASSIPADTWLFTFVLREFNDVDHNLWQQISVQIGSFDDGLFETYIRVYIEIISKTKSMPLLVHSSQDRLVTVLCLDNYEMDTK